ncbi:MAG TPA: hypothetical protein VK628_09930, partial [Flavitalea sp.]|nr:hypothetical protein [Flavitalea sp.]
MLTCCMVLSSTTIQCQQNNGADLYKASILTPVNSFLSDVEGPAVDNEGILYAVNFQKKGTIARISDSGEISLFLTLPEGSVGNGIRFDSHGNML